MPQNRSNAVCCSILAGMVLVVTGVILLLVLTGMSKGC